MNRDQRIIFHIDANSAYLSWTAADLLNRGYPRDIRRLPSAIAGDPDNRRGIILAKSIPAKKYGVATGESLFEARGKCPGLLVFPPDYELYMDCSQAMYDILLRYSSSVQRYSIDECFLEYMPMGEAGKLRKKVQEKAVEEAFFAGVRDEALRTAGEIKDKIRAELGFTVNIGVGPNKLLAKMAGELRKPDVLETIWADEIEKKLWPLPVRELFMVGKAAERKLKAVNIRTIGDLAQADPLYLKTTLKSHGVLIRDYARGLDEEPVIANGDILQKGVGNSITMKYDMTTEQELRQVLLALCEKVGQRMRRLKRAAAVIRVSVRDAAFFQCSRQAQIPYPTESTSELYRQACRLFFGGWRGEPIRRLGVCVSGLAPADQRQLSLFQEEEEKARRADEAVDRIRRRFGNESLVRGVFANTGVAPLQGGVYEGDYIMMGG